MKPLSVLHVVVAGDIGGAERFLVDLTRASDVERVRHSIWLRTPNPALRVFFQDHGLSLVDDRPARENPLAFLWRSLGPTDVASLVRRIDDNAANLVHCHTLGSHVIAVRAARRASVKTIRTEHAIGHYFDVTASPFTRWAARRTDRVVCISDFVARTLQREEPELRVSTIHNGVDPLHFSPRESEAEGPLRFIVVSRLENVKRVDLAVSALVRAPAATLVVVGDGSERARLERLATDIGVRERIEFVGYQRDPRPYLASSDALISPSPVEGFGLSIVEAMAMARPAIAISGSAADEIVIDGATGILVNGADAQSLGSALNRADRISLRTMGRAARDAVVARFSMQSTAKRYTDLYEELATRS